MEGLYTYLPVVLVLIASLPFSGSDVQPTKSSRHRHVLHDQDQQCPTWFFWNQTSRECECGPGTAAGVLCSQANKSILIHQFHCMTYDNQTDSTVAAYCPFSDLEAEERFVPMPKNKSELNKVTCGKANREGLLCSKCKPGYGPAVLSYDQRCAKCSDSYFGWFLYLSIALIPTTVFFLVIVLCQVRTTSAPLNFFVLAFQVVALSIVCMVPSRTSVSLRNNQNLRRNRSNVYYCMELGLFSTPYPSFLCE